MLRTLTPHFGRELGLVGRHLVPPSKRLYHPLPAIKTPHNQRIVPKPTISTVRRRQMSQSTHKMEELIQSACDSKLIPGAVLFAADKSGKLDYRRVFGVASLEDGEQSKPLAMDTTMWFASCTKLVTSIAAMQCVERGLVSLDDDLRPWLPELDQVDILHSQESGEINGQTKNTAPTTLRHLLSHSSGFCYEFNSPTLQEWRGQQDGEPPKPHHSIHKRFSHPILYEPGTSWSYGPSTDWAGLLVERLTKRSLQDYCKEHIWGPLGIKDLTFFLSTRPDLQARRGKMSWRIDQPEAVLAEQRQPLYEPDFEDCQGGGGICGAPHEYIKILRAVLLATDASASDAASIPPAQLLRRSTANALFEPQLSEGGIQALQAVAEVPRYNEMLGGLPPSIKKDWGLGGLVILDDIPGTRRKGTLSWGGTPNLTWWIDRTAGLCGFYASQIMPIGDAKSNEMVRAFEKAMYQRVGELNQGGE